MNAVNMMINVMNYALYKNKYNNHSFGTSLYRYRKCNDYTMAALKNNELWGSLGSEMEDKNDCSIIFDQSNSDNIIIDSEKIVPTFTNYYRMSKYLVCLTPYSNSYFMWKNYADDFQGFVVEYDTEELLKNVHEYLLDIYLNFNFSFKEKNELKMALIRYDLGISKVKYANSPIDITDDLLLYLKDFEKTISTEPNEETVKKNQITTEKILSTKIKKFKNEKEVRLMLPSGYNFETDINIMEKHKVLFKIKPKLIILGKKMGVNEKKEIIAFANDSQIKVIQKGRNK